MAEKKKILYVITQGEWGGAQRYVFDLATNLINEFDITVAVGEPAGRKDLQQKLEAQNSKLDNDKVKVVQLQHLTRRISPWHDILAVFELARLYKKIKPAIAHLNSSKASILGSLTKILISDIKYSISIIYTVHGWVFNEPMSPAKKKLYTWLEKITAGWKDKIIVLSQTEKEVAVSILGIPENKLEKIPLGIPASEIILTQPEARKILQEKTRFNVPENTTWTGTIANFYPTKGLDNLIEAVSLVKEKLKNCHFVIIGEGPERKKLERMIKEKNLEQVIHLTGWLENAAESLPAFDYFILPSRKEGYPYTVLEAIQQRVPIIATSVGGIPEIIMDKKTGLLVETQNARLLAEAIIFALNHPTEMKAYSVEALNFLQSHGLSKMLQRTIYFYQAVLQHQT